MLALLLGMHGLAWCALAISLQQPFVLLICSLAVGLSAMAVVRELRFPAPGERIEGFCWYLDDRLLELWLGDGRSVRVEQLTYTAYMPWLVALKLQRTDRALPTWLVFSSDQVSPEAWRRLRVVLRFAPRFSVPPPAKDS